MTLEQVIERLEVLFPIEMQNRRIITCIPNNTIKIKSGELEVLLKMDNKDSQMFNADCDYDVLLQKQEQVLSFLLYHKYCKIMLAMNNMSYLNIEQLFDDSIFKFFIFDEEELNECKEFVNTHPAFPKT